MAHFDASATGLHQSAQNQHRLLKILNSIDFLEESSPMPQWEIFDESQIVQVLKSCEQVNFRGERSIDIQKLNVILYNELDNLQGAAAMGQRQSILEEIKR